MTTINIKLSDDLMQRPFLNRSDVFLPKKLSNILLNTTYNGYNNSIEPLLSLGLAAMVPFRGRFIKETRGFPVAYLYGPTSAGKTNLLNTLTYFYGFKEDFINSGDSTILSMWRNLGKYSHMPIIYDEISRKVISDSLFEGLIKSAYQGTGRDKITERKTSINATLILSSNFQPSQRPEILNRLLLCNFEQQNFKLNEVIGFNEIRENYLSNLLPAVFKYRADKIIDIFQEKREYIKSLNSSIDSRSNDNIAIAYTGYQVLLDIAEEMQPDEIKESFERFVANYTEILKIKSPWEEFLGSLPLLARNKGIVYGKDYKYAYDKQESNENGQIINNLSAHYLCIHFERAYEVFIKQYRQINKNIPPTNKELLSYAQNDKRILSGKGQLTKSINLNGIKKRCLVIDVSENYELSHLDAM